MTSQFQDRLDGIKNFISLEGTFQMPLLEDPDLITVNKAQLLETLHKNREEHIAIYNEAMIVFRAKVIEAYEKQLAEIKDGADIKLHITGLPTPEEHIEDYDLAIEMYEWTTPDEVVLDKQNFNQLVRNKWAWSRSFTANSASYSSSAR